MGQGLSKEDEEEYVELRELGAVRLAVIGHQFNELYSESSGKRGVLLDRAAFARHFEVPLILGDRLFEAFDTEKNGVVSFEEFARGLAVILHGSTSDKCELLFKVFNLAGDEGVSRDELQFMLHAAFDSAVTIMKALSPRAKSVMEGTAFDDIIHKCVEEAFQTCDLTGNDKLLPNEFELWMRRNPALLDSILNWRAKVKPEAHLATASQPTLRGVTPESTQEDTRASSESTVEYASTASGNEVTTSRPLSTSESAPDPLVVTSPSRDATQELQSAATLSAGDVPEERSRGPEDAAIASGVPNALSQLPVAAQAKLMDHDATMESIDIRDASMAGGSGAATPDVSVMPQSISLSPEPSDVHVSISDTTSTPRDIRQDTAEPTPSNALNHITPVFGKSEPVLRGSTSNATATSSGMDEVGLSTPGTTPSTSRHPTPAPSGNLSSSPALVRTQGSSTPSSSTQTASTSSPPSDNTTNTSTTNSSESDGRFFRKKKPAAHHLPTAQYEAGETHIVDQDRVSVQSPLFDSEYSMHSAEQVSTERRRTSWLASPQTQQLLANMATNSQLNRVDQSFLTMPGLLLESTQVPPDPVRELLVRFGLEAESRDRYVLNVDSVTMDQVGLQKLMGSGCYRAALELTCRFLSAHGQGPGQRGQPAMHTHRTLQMWLARVALLMKLGQYAVAHNELKAFGNFDSPDMYFEYYPDAYPNRTGTMVPFSLRLLHAIVPQYASQPAEAIDRLQYVTDLAASILHNLESGLTEDGQSPLPEEEREASLHLWNQRLLATKYAMANALLASKDYDLAIRTYLSIAVIEPASAPLLYSLSGRIYLQLGDLLSAKDAFHAAEAKAGDTSSDVYRKLHSTHKGFIDVTNGRYQDAFRHFQAVLRVESFNPVAINNMAVCLLYSGKLNEAVQVLEELVWKDPPSHLQAASICNLCTLYELQSARANDKKLKLLKMVAKHCGDGFSVESLKLST